MKRAFPECQHNADEADEEDAADNSGINHGSRITGLMAFVKCQPLTVGSWRI
jgi:hypothetical protein